jgi:hypothetical protein
MKSPVSSGLALLVAAATTLQFTGCCLVGLGIGAVSDASKPPDKLAVSGLEVETIEPGTRVDLLNGWGQPLTLDRDMIRDSPRASGDIGGIRTFRRQLSHRGT